MKRLYSLVSVLLCVIMLLSACTTGKVETSSNADASQATNSSNGSSTRTDINLTLSSLGNSMDPHNSGVTIDLQVQEQIYESLVHVDEKSQVTPRLAKSYTVSDDGLVYTFELRDDVFFHNNEKMKASDVVWSMERAMKSSQMATYCGAIEKVEATGDNTVEITLKYAFAPFINYLYMVKIMSEAEVISAGDMFSSKVTHAGTGPYMLTTYEPSTKIVLNAFPNYYRGEAAIKTINYYVITDSSSALIAFQNGEIDFAAIPTANWAEVEASSQYTNELVLSGDIRYLALNVGQKGPLADKRVRQAVQYALDKEAIAIIASDGLGVPADHMIAVGMYDGAVETDWVYEYNIDKCKELLAEAGYPNGVDIGVIETATQRVVAEAIQAQLEAAGIKCEVLVGEAATMVVDWRAGKYDMIVNRFPPAFTYDYYRRYNDYKIGVVFMKYNLNKDCDHEYITATFDKAAATMDKTERDAIYKELEEYLMDIAAWVPLFYPQIPVAWNKNLNAYGYMTYYEVYDWSWK